MQFMLSVWHGGQRIGDGIVIVWVQQRFLGGLLKPVERRVSLLTASSANALDIVASSTLLIHAVRLTAS